MTKSPKDRIAYIDLSLIDGPKNVDRFELAPELVLELAQSISEIGLLQPILLRVDGDRYEVIAGHRRFLAHKHLELKKIKAIVRVMSDQEAAVSRATENLARVDLTPVEEAFIFKELLNTHGLTFEQVGAKVGKSPGIIRRRLDLLKMPPQLQELVHKKRISIAVAEELWPITDVAMLDYYLSFAVDGGCTSTVARSWCKEWRDQVRRQVVGDVEGRGVSGPFEPRPTYVACDLCVGPMELGQETVLRLCPSCFQTIKENM